ncbi:MT-A70-domain-containing protein [Umbelopsis sp. PMI_123]|nr:MT-A70-domain-containing protein [Umbelopsis sp. PMI_123]
MNECAFVDWFSSYMDNFARPSYRFTLQYSSALYNVYVITACGKLHFKYIINSHTESHLGDCSYLNTCHRMGSCKYMHYCLDATVEELKPTIRQKISSPLLPPQCIKCDIRKLDFDVIGKFTVILADPPWDIHMNLPYGTMTDDEMKGLKISKLQDQGLLFLWVTSRAMELGRECLMIWGYELVQELVWVKINQLQRIIRTGRTGHWLNHSKEHCLIGRKGDVPSLNVGLDCDVLVSEVRETSRKPDELYSIINRLSPGTRKLEMFGREHNLQPGWLTLGNQLKDSIIYEPQVVERYNARYVNYPIRLYSLPHE